MAGFVKRSEIYAKKICTRMIIFIGKEKARTAPCFFLWYVIERFFLVAMQPITDYTKSGECPAMRVYIKISNLKQECFWGKQSASNSVIATNEGCTASFTRDAWLRKKESDPTESGTAFGLSKLVTI